MTGTQVLLLGVAAAAAAAAIVGGSDDYDQERQVREWEGLDLVPDRGDNPPVWALDPPVWDEAREAVRPYWARYQDPWAVVTHVYRNMGGRVG
jgi:hypothetical protein